MANKSAWNKDNRRAPSNLSIEDSGTARVRLGMKPPPQPYALFAKKEPGQQRTDLRKLSKEIKAQRRALRKNALFTPLTHLAAVIVVAWRKLVGK